MDYETRAWLKQQVDATQRARHVKARMPSSEARRKAERRAQDKARQEQAKTEQVLSFPLRTFYRWWYGQ